jgi:peptidoglycan/xylan/chitin deacetylase (PgdA/CDA1 family)
MLNPILLYHGVTTAQSVGIENYSGKHLPLAAFEEQMRYLHEHCYPMHLKDMAELLAHGYALPDGACAVTFDDSYQNVVENAVPVLVRYGIPATFFVATAYLDNPKRMYWTDILEHAMNRAGVKASEVRRIKEQYKTLPFQERGGRIAVLRGLYDETLDNGQDVPNYRNMTWDDLRAIDANPLFVVGGHTHTHQVMSLLPEWALKDEINNCLGRLEIELGHPVDLFSYPEGQAAHYNQAVIDALKAAGVVLCPTAIPGDNPPGTDPFHLRRVMVGFEGQPFPFWAGEGVA